MILAPGLGVSFTQPSSTNDWTLVSHTIELTSLDSWSSPWPGIRAQRPAVPCWWIQPDVRPGQQLDRRPSAHRLVRGAHRGTYAPKKARPDWPCRRQQCADGHGACSAMKLRSSEDSTCALTPWCPASRMTAAPRRLAWRCRIAQCPGAHVVASVVSVFR